MTLFARQPRREMPPEVRDRLRRKLWSELDRPAGSRLSRARAPIAVVIGAIVVLAAGTVVFAKNGPAAHSPSPAVGAAHFAASPADAELDRCYAVATSARQLPERPQWRAVASSEADGVSVTAVRVAGKPVFCETTQTTVTVSDPDGQPGYAAPSGTAAMFATRNGTFAGMVDPGWNGFELRVPELVDTAAHRVEIVKPEVIGDGLFVARTRTPVEPQNQKVSVYAVHGSTEYLFGSVPPVLVARDRETN